MTDNEQISPESNTSGFSHANHWDNIFEAQLEKESDRAAVILTASIFDNSLAELLKNYLVSTPSSSDDLFDSPNAPLSTFSAKIVIAHRLGLISSRFTRDLHTIRKIRNEFAHNIDGCSFEDSRVKSRVLELYKNSHKSRQKYRDVFPSGTRGDFMLVCSWMLWSLNSLVEHCDKLSEAGLEFGYEGSDSEQKE